MSSSNLSSLILRIQREHFFTVQSKDQTKRNGFLFDLYSKIKLPSFLVANQEPSNKDLNEIENWEKRKTQFISLGIALTAMFFYACSINLIRFDVLKTNLRYIETD
jgi:hypothetical protein